MKKIIFLLVLFFILSFNAIGSEISIVDINFLLKNSEKGKKIQKEIDKLNSNQKKIFEKKQMELKEKEKKLHQKKMLFLKKNLKKKLKFLNQI